ncbi:MAG: hypothetical protein PQJ46_02385 [Spirochaetales bacterium]|nr:hypothetical protein [Spirochaetales bacterium]
MIKKILTILLLATLICFPLFSKDDENVTDEYEGITAYSQGQQLLTMTLGGIFPLFNILPQAPTGSVIEDFGTLNIGVAGGIKWGSFIRDNLSLGAEIAFSFETTANRTLNMIPITFVTSYYFMAYPFEFPIYIGTGAAISIIDDYFRVIPIIKPGFGVYWNFNDDWAFGLDVNYWFMPEIYLWGDYQDESSIGNFLHASLSAVYHF